MAGSRSTRHTSALGRFSESLTYNRDSSKFGGRDRVAVVHTDVKVLSDADVLVVVYVPGMEVSVSTRVVVLPTAFGGLFSPLVGRGALVRGGCFGGPASEGLLRRACFGGACFGGPCLGGPCFGGLLRS